MEKQNDNAQKPYVKIMPSDDCPDKYVIATSGTPQDVIAILAINAARALRNISDSAPANLKNEAQRKIQEMFIDFFNRSFSSPELYSRPDILN